MRKHFLGRGPGFMNTVTSSVFIFWHLCSIKNILYYVRQALAPTASAVVIITQLQYSVFDGSIERGLLLNIAVFATNPVANRACACFIVKH